MRRKDDSFFWVTGLLAWAFLIFLTLCKISGIIRIDNGWRNPPECDYCHRIVDINREDAYVVNIEGKHWHVECYRKYQGNSATSTKPLEEGESK